MRAIYLADEFPKTLGPLQIEGEFLHHLVNVLRVKIGFELLLLSGRGVKALGKISRIEKKSLQLEVISIHEEVSASSSIEILLGIPKKEALGDMLKMAVELGVRKIHLFRSEYSTENIMSEDRIEKMLVSGMEQSNNPYKPEIFFYESLNEIDSAKFKFIVFHLETELNKKFVLNPSPDQLSVLCIGSEGGWSPYEINWFQDKGAQFISLPTPIQRAPTALASCLGWYLGTLENLKL